jgi:hypothetical protein
VDVCGVELVEALIDVIATLKELGVLLPQRFEATTDTLPLELLVVVLIFVSVLEPVHPLGKVQIYEVAPDTGAIE